MHAVIIGASGGIGAALVDALATRDGVTVHALSRRSAEDSRANVHTGIIDIEDEASITSAAAAVKDTAGCDIGLVIVASGILSDGAGLKPEKSYRHQSMNAFEQVFRVNTFGPALVAKYFLPLMPRKDSAVFAALSARVGSISDNGIGGWHAYRASKTALNMLIKNFAIEQARRNANSICVGLHPGTVNTDLSSDFQTGLPDGQVVTPATSAANLLGVINGLTPEQSGKVFDWAGKEIPA